jgi:hypothetical protein
VDNIWIRTLIGAVLIGAVFIQHLFLKRNEWSEAISWIRSRVSAENERSNNPQLGAEWGHFAAPGPGQALGYDTFHFCIKRLTLL